jgi:hypothetical protein
MIDKYEGSEGETLNERHAEEYETESVLDTIEKMYTLHDQDDEPVEFDRSVYNNPK